MCYHLTGKKSKIVDTSLNLPTTGDKKHESLNIMCKFLVQHKYHLNKTNLVIGLNTQIQCLNYPSLRNGESLFN